TTERHVLGRARSCGLLVRAPAPDSAGGGDRDGARARMIAPPLDIVELAERAQALAGRSIEAIARSLDFARGACAVHTTGNVGGLVERALGATGGSSAIHDFPHLGIELKTIPMHGETPTESTYVCTVPIDDADRAEWSTSWTRAKLSHVLWVPFDVDTRH